MNALRSIAFALGAFWAAGTASATEFKFLTEELPPYNFSENGKVVGICAEAVRLMAQKLKHPDTISIVPWSRGYNLTLRESGYGLFCASRSSEREKLFKWVGPLVTDYNVFYGRKGSGIIINSLEDAKKVKRIGTYKDDMGEQYLMKMGFTNLDSVAEDKLNAKKLAAGRIDLWSASDLAGKMVARREGVEDKVEIVFWIEPMPLYLAFSRDTPDAETARWSAALEEIKADGTYNKLLIKYGGRR